jgi:serine/threonine-protein kinase
LLAGAFLGHTSLRRILWILAAAVMVVLAMLVWMFIQRPAAPIAPAHPAVAQMAMQSIAVMPFVNQSGNADDEYFSDGMTDELASGLMKVPGLRVAARSSAFTFKGKPADARDVGAKLRVASVLEGTVRRAGAKLRVTAELVNTADGLAIWSERYEREAKDLFQVQDDITAAIVSALRLKLGPAPGEAPVAKMAEAPRRSVDPEAYDLYQRGRFFMYKESEEGLRKSLEYFQRALDKDPNFAPPYAAMSHVWTFLADQYVAPKDAYPRAKAAAQKAIELDPENSDAYTFMALARASFDWDFPAAEQDFQRALRNNPNSVDAHYSRALILAVNPKYSSEAIAEADQAIALDPLSPLSSWTREFCLVVARRYDDVIAQHKHTAELDPDFYYADSFVGNAYREKGMLQQSLAEYQRNAKTTGQPLFGLAITYARMGRNSEARSVLHDLLALSKKQYVAGDSIASVYVALGERDLAFEWLGKARDARAGSMVLQLAMPTWDPIRNDPRFVALVKQAHPEW